MGEVGIPMLCYNWLAVIPWMRTSTALRGRGGALVTGFDSAALAGLPPTWAGEVSEQQLWDAFTYFIERVVPVAEKAGVRLALHPDDPPLSPVRGLSRIMVSVEAFQRAIDIVDSPANSITLCQGNFTLMTDDLPAVIRHFGAQGKIAFGHFRDVRGTRERFVETFHDGGPTDMLARMRRGRKSVSTACCGQTTFPRSRVTRTTTRRTRTWRGCTLSATWPGCGRLPNAVLTGRRGAEPTTPSLPRGRDSADRRGLTRQAVQSSSCQHGSAFSRLMRHLRHRLRSWTKDVDRPPM